MLANSILKISDGELSEGIEVDSTVKAVVEFIELYSGEFSQKVKGEIATSEKVLTDKLCKFLNRKGFDYPFYFQHENVENPSTGNSPQTDIGTLSISEQIIVGDRSYGEFDSFFSMEAKRLPTPGQNREREYVIGHIKPCGGIERFKKGIHGKDLRYAAIIGYIQVNDFNSWLSTINGWIDDLVKRADGNWLEKDKLVKVFESSDGSFVKFESRNTKIACSVDEVKIYHFWIDLKSS